MIRLFSILSRKTHATPYFFNPFSWTWPLRATCHETSGKGTELQLIGKNRKIISPPSIPFHYVENMSFIRRCRVAAGKRGVHRVHLSSVVFVSRVINTFCWNNRDPDARKSTFVLLELARWEDRRCQPHTTPFKSPFRSRRTPRLDRNEGFRFRCSIISQLPYELANRIAFYIARTLASNVY